MSIAMSCLSLQAGTSELESWPGGETWKGTRAAQKIKKKADASAHNMCGRNTEWLEAEE